MKLLGKLITYLALIVVGFLLGISFHSWKTILPESLQEMDLIETVTVREDTMSNPSHSEPIEHPVLRAPVQNQGRKEVDYRIVEERIIELVNELRTEKGLNPVERNDMLKKAATIRAQETEESFSHTRPNETDAFTVLQEEGIEYPYRMIGENLAMGTNYLDEIGMAELFFEGWVDSEGHYETMIEPAYQEIGVGIHYDGHYLYATQFFGTQMGQ